MGDRRALRQPVIRKTRRLRGHLILEGAVSTGRAEPSQRSMQCPVACIATFPYLPAPSTSLYPTDRVPMNKRNPILDDIRSSLHTRVAQYQAQRACVREALKADRTIPTREAEANRAWVIREVGVLSEFFERRLFPLMRITRQHVPDLLARDERVACYWLVGKVANNWRAVFILARGGMHYEVMECMRSIEESIWLGCHFVFGHPDELAKWFEGEIVSPSKTRKRIDAWMNDRARELDLDMPIEETLLGIYSGLSRYSHSSYATLLDSYDVWHDEFDFERIAGFHHLRSSGIPYMRGALEGTVNCLILFFQHCGDHKNRAAADSLYRELSPGERRGWEERVRGIAADLGKKFT